MALGEQHPEVALCLSSLATTLKDLGKKEEAEACLRRALTAQLQASSAQQQQQHKHNSSPPHP